MRTAISPRKRIDRGLIFSVACLLLSGCGQRPDTDVTESPKYNFSKFAGKVWKTKVTVALADIKAYTWEHLINLLPPDLFDPAHANYRPPPYLEKVIAVLPVGTRIRLDRLMKDNGEWGGVRVTGLLEDERMAQLLESGKIIYVERHVLAKNR